MKLILVRHGETVWNSEGRVQGASDIALSETGREQIHKLAAALKDESLDAIFSSPLRRAHETALILGRFHSREIRLEEGLMEMNQGDFEGLSFNELRKDHGPFLKQWIADPASVRMPNGETLSELQDRAWQAVLNILAGCEGTALAVSHNFAITTILCKIQGIALKDFRRLRVDPASKSVVRFRQGAARIEVINDLCHLAERVREKT